jgi:hypothetical protein
MPLKAVSSMVWCRITCERSSIIAVEREREREGGRDILVVKE